MQIINCAQGDDAWKVARCGLITASMFKVARERLKTGPNKGDFSGKAKDYAFRLAVERISWEPLDEGFETWSMQRGHALEPEAREAHSQRIGKPIERAGIVVSDDERFGASADGIIGTDGGSEYKCLVSPERLRNIILDQDLSDFTDQVQGCLWLTGRSWWHFVLYCPALKPIGKELFIHEVRRDEGYIQALEQDLLAFDALVSEYQAGIEASQAWWPSDHEAAPRVAAGGFF